MINPALILVRRKPTLRRSALSLGRFRGSYALSRSLPTCEGTRSFLLEPDGNGARGAFGSLLLLACHCA